MNSNPPQINYPTEPSRLSYYPGCNTPINGEIWSRHIDTLRTLKRQAEKLGLWEVAFEFSMLIGMHISEQLKFELKATK